MTIVCKLRVSWTVALSAIVAALIAAPSPSLAQQKTVKACQDEWRANKDANQAAGITERAYVTKCRAGTAAAAPTAPAATQAPTAAPPVQRPAAIAPAARQAPATAAPARPAPTVTSARPTGTNEFSTEAEAKARCPVDTVVWANTDSKIYHFSGNRNYGNTKAGAYMCEKDTAAAGIRAAKNEKHP